MPHDEFDVVVIGAGAAGLGAARRLAGAGLSYVVLEARERPGGRAWTVDIGDGLPVDLGCGWLHSADRNPLVAIAERQGRQIDRTPPPWGRPNAQVGPNQQAMSGFGEAIGRFRARVDAQAEQASDVACDTLLDPDEPLNPLIDAVSTYYSGAELAKVSALDLAAYEDSGVNWRVRDGYGAVIAGLAQGQPVRYRAAVRAIDRRGAKLAIETEAGALRCRAAIVTLPSDVLAQTPEFFRPALPEKTAAAADLPLGLADKLYMELTGRHDFPADSRAFGAINRSATAAYHFHPMGKPLVEAYFGGELAQELERGGEAAAWDFALCELTGLFGAKFRDAVRPLRFHGWRGDTFARGAYSYARPGGAASRLRLALPVEERIFFAGEACSRASYSTAHGAYETGLAAAETALAALAPHASIGANGSRLRRAPSTGDR